MLPYWLSRWPRSMARKAADMASTLKQRIEQAKLEMARWTPELRADMAQVVRMLNYEQRYTKGNP